MFIFHKKLEPDTMSVPKLIPYRYIYLDIGNICFRKKKREQIGSKSTVDVIGNEKFLRRKVQEEQMKSRFEYRYELAILFYYHTYEYFSKST